MIFATYWFLAFVLLFFPLYWLAGRPGVRLVLVLAASLAFQIHYASAAGVIPILALGIVVYLLGLSENRFAWKIGVILCVLELAFYKYSLFLTGSIVGMVNMEMAAAFTENVRKTLPDAPPLGISFFAFEFIHYLVDRHHGTPAIRKPLDFGLFAIFFPTLVAGPIKRYEQFLPAAFQGLGKVCAADVVSGMVQVAFGFAKKLIADNLTLWIESEQAQFGTVPLGERWLLFIGIGFRILLDFSGYSDIAIGLARMMGIAILPNFNWPYLSTNIRDFWRRWHISLSSWIRDYVYIPLGGNRHGNLRRFFNGLAAFSLCGLWHGASWNFVLWGLYHGLGLSISTSYRSVPGVGPKLASVLDRAPLLGWAVTLVFVWMGWLLFFYPVPVAWQMACQLLNLHLPS